MEFNFLNTFRDRLTQFWRQIRSKPLLPLSTLVWITGLAIAAFALWSFTEIADEVLEQESLAFDQMVLETIHQFHSATLDRVMVTITTLGDPTLLVILCIGLGLVSVIQRRWAEAMALIIGAGGAVSLNFLLKTVFSRTRPSLWDSVIHVDFYSFPSGHATVSLVIYGLIAYWLSHRFRQQQIGIGIGLLILVIAIGFSRLYLGVHWPTDVMAGYAAGTVWLLACLLGAEVLKA